MCLLKEKVKWVGVFVEVGRRKSNMGTKLVESTFVVFLLVLNQ